MKLYSFSPIGLATQTPLERAVPEFLRGQGGMVTSETDQTPLGKAGERFKNAINTLWDDMSKGLDNLVDKVKTGGKKAMSAFDDMAEKEKERLKKEQKMSDFMGKQKWSEFQSWSRMGMTLAQMPEGKPRGWWSTVAGQYATGKIDYATMLKQEPVEKFQKEQEKKLQEMITTEAGAEVPSFGLMRNAYEQLFNIAAKGGEGGKAKDYMNKALDAMQADMKQQTANQRKELKLLEGIEEHTAVIAGGYGKETPEGKKTTYVPTGPNVSDDIRLDVQNMGPWGTGF